jgi:negative regulator of flagellin synthesis FlgM
MIKSVGQAVTSSVDVAKLREGAKAKAASPVDTLSTSDEASGAIVSTPAARMAAQGAPVDVDKIAAIKAAIASGNYPVHPERIAEKMIALDLPGRG